jgi:3-deoxy-D-manno-octulosonate 8-phosphate phosphatase KdsC-like HAD superfamily phosphatase
MGDDLPDLPLMKLTGLSIAVADAHEIVRQSADWTTRAPGGHGAVREVCEELLTAKGVWEQVLDKY